MMVPKNPDTPDSLRPYIFHGVDLQASGKEATADCPWCGRENKFSINVQTGQWRCFVCDLSGNVYVFLRKLLEVSIESTDPSQYSGLSKDRRLLYPETLHHWHLAISILTHRWLVPGYNAEGKLTNLYQYGTGDGRRLLYSTPTLGHGLLGRNLYMNRDSVFLCEGPWDAMALWEIVQRAKQTDSGLTVTGNPNASMAASADVLAVPTCTVFSESWLPLLEGKSVCLLYDNDHPRKTDDMRLVPAAGYAATERVTGILTRTNQRPREVRYLNWGPQGYNPGLPSGYDVRDLLTQGKP